MSVGVKITPNKGPDISVSYKPIDALSISLAPSFSHSRNKMQYISTGTVGDENRYVVGEIDQATARLSLRMTYMMTPNLSVQAGDDLLALLANTAISNTSRMQMRPNFIDGTQRFRPNGYA